MQKYIILVLIICSLSATNSIYGQMVLEAKIEYLGENYDGTKIKNPQFKIYTSLNYRMQPLLNYIFFNENSAEIDSRYLIEEIPNNTFDENKLFNFSALVTYQNILKIIGKRLRDNPKASIEIKGYISQSEKDNNKINISKLRAENVKSYFINNWNIEEKRIKTNNLELPDNLSSSSINPELADIENCRVEFYSDNAKILSPIIAIDTIRRPEPTKIIFLPQLLNEVPLSSWEFSASEFKKYANNKPRRIKFVTLPDYIEWTLPNYEDIIPKDESPIEFTLTVKDTNSPPNEYTTKTNIIPITIKEDNKMRSVIEGDYEVSRFNLILFPFKQSDLTLEHREIINWIEKNDVLNKSSEIEIIGFTDNIGNDIYNKQLASKRAKTVEHEVKKYASFTKQNIKVNWFGEDKKLYSNKLPEGRFYNRTVQIVIKTKIKN